MKDRFPTLKKWFSPYVFVVFGVLSVCTTLVPLAIIFFTAAFFMYAGSKAHKTITAGTMLVTALVLVCLGWQIAAVAIIGTAFCSAIHTVVNMQVEG